MQTAVRLLVLAQPGKRAFATTSSAVRSRHVAIGTNCFTARPIEEQSGFPGSVLTGGDRQATGE